MTPDYAGESEQKDLKIFVKLFSLEADDVWQPEIIELWLKTVVLHYDHKVFLLCVIPI